MEIVIMISVFSAVVALLASGWGRNPWGYFFLSLFLSPAIGLIVLLVQGKTPEAKARDAQLAKFYGEE